MASMVEGCCSLALFRRSAHFSLMLLTGVLLVSEISCTNTGSNSVVITNCPEFAKVGEGIQLTVVVTPDDLTIATQADNTTIVDGNTTSPTITPLEAGELTMTITATDTEGNSDADTCMVTVQEDDGCSSDADCNDEDSCTTDSCELATGDCLNTPVECEEGECVDGECVCTCTEDADCDDGDLCNGSEVCSNCACESIDPIDCDDDDLCTTDTCDSTTGECSHEEISCGDDVCSFCDPDTGDCLMASGCSEDADCDDGLFCNGIEICDTSGCGTCLSGGNPCGEDECSFCEETGTGYICAFAECGLAFTLLRTDDLEGTTGNDSISAPLLYDSDTETQKQSLQTGDSADGLEGNDTLQASLIGEIVAPMLSNIETLSFSVFAATTIDASNVSGAETIELSDSADDLSVTNLANLVDVVFSDNDDATVDLTLVFAASANGGVNDQIDVEINDATANVLIADGVERLNISSSGTTASLERITSNSMQHIAASGSTSLDLGALTTDGTDSIETIDAGDMSASFSATTNDAAHEAEITLGSAGDSLSLGTSGGSGIVVNCGGGGDSVSGSPQNDEINGQDGEDNIHGGSGNDEIDGGDGNDILNGGLGADTITSGVGSDELRFDNSVAASGSTDDEDVVNDWNDGSDVIAISAGDSFGSNGATGLAQGRGAAGSLTATAQGSVSVQLVSQNVGSSSLGGSTQFIKFTTAVAGGGSEQAAFNSAIGTTVLTELSNATLMVGSYYDMSASEMVLIEIDSTATLPSSIESGDTVRIIARVAMSQTDYTNINAQDLVIY